MTEHGKVWIKVNAPVDRDAYQLILALSEFPQLQTIGSYQASNGWARVWFVYGEYWDHPWRDLTDFVFGFLGPKVSAELGNRVQLSIRVTEGGGFRAEMAVRTEAIPAVVTLLKDLQRSSLAA
jgi:hypothetical protein